MAHNLLLLALSLLIAAQQPNVPIALKEQAVAIAQQAISVALVEIPLAQATNSSDTPTNVSIGTSVDEAVVKSPTCTLTATLLPEKGGMGDDLYRLEWTYENADRMSLFDGSPFTQNDMQSKSLVVPKPTNKANFQLSFWDSLQPNAVTTCTASF